MKKPQVPSPLEITRAIAAGRPPMPVATWDHVVVGKAVQAAIDLGWVRENYGSSPDWGCWSATPAGREVVRGVNDREDLQSR